MKTRKWNFMLSAVILINFLILMPVSEVLAENDEEYITITVDAEDDNEGLMYSIDSVDENAFTNSNTFTIPAGTSHTIYVKDAAGNITSQDYSPQAAQTEQEMNMPPENESTQDINIDVEIGKKDYSSILDSSPAEPGEGTMHDRTVTDGSDDGEKVFYTVTTAEGDTFYMVIDKNQTSDNVYLLNTVSRSDLAALATKSETEQKDETEEDNLLTALQNEKEADNVSDETNMPSKNGGDGGISPNIIILVFALIIGGVYYYIKIYKNKKEQQMDVMDAMDMDDFAAEEDEEEDDEAEFDMADDEKEAFLDNLINEDDESELYDADPNDYADSGNETEYGDNELAADFKTDYDPELDEPDFEDGEEEE